MEEPHHGAHMDLSCGRGLVGPQPGPGLGWGGHQVWGAASGLGPPHPTAPPQGRVQQLLSTDPTQQTAGAPPSPGTPKGLGIPPLLGCSPRTPHSPWGEPGPSTVPPLPPRGRMRVHPSQAPCLLPPRETPALWHCGAGWGQHRNSQVPPMSGGAVGPPPCTWHPGGSCSAFQCQGQPGSLQAVHRCFQGGHSCTPGSWGAAPPKEPPASLGLWQPELGW